MINVGVPARVRGKLLGSWGGKGSKQGDWWIIVSLSSRSFQGAYCRRRADVTDAAAAEATSFPRSTMFLAETRGRMIPTNGSTMVVVAHVAKLTHVAGSQKEISHHSCSLRSCSRRRRSYNLEQPVDGYQR